MLGLQSFATYIWFIFTFHWRSASSSNVIFDLLLRLILDFCAVYNRVLDAY